MKKLLALTIVATSATALACAPKAFDDSLSRTEAFFGAATQLTSYSNGKAEHAHKTKWEEKNGTYEVTFYDYAQISAMNFTKWGGVIGYISFVEGKAATASVDFVAFSANANTTVGDNNTRTINYTIANNALVTTNEAALSTAGGAYGNNGSAAKWKAQSEGFIKNYILGKNKLEILSMNLSEMNILNKDVDYTAGTTATNLNGTTSVAGSYQAIVAAIKGSNKI